MQAPPPVNALLLITQNVIYSRRVLEYSLRYSPSTRVANYSDSTALLLSYKGCLSVERPQRLGVERKIRKKLLLKNRIGLPPSTSLLRMGGGIKRLMNVTKVECNGYDKMLIKFKFHHRFHDRNHERLTVDVIM